MMDPPSNRIQMGHIDCYGWITGYSKSVPVSIGMIPVDWLNLGGLAVKSLYFGAPSGNQRWLAGSLKQIIELSIRKQASIYPLVI